MLKSVKRTLSMPKWFDLRNGTLGIPICSDEVIITHTNKIQGLLGHLRSDENLRLWLVSW